MAQNNPNSNLTQFSDAELKIELQRRKEIAQQQLRDARREKADFWKSKIDHLLEIIPNHSRTSCDDVNPINDERCTRCYLLYAKQFDWDDDRELHIYTSRLSPLD